MFKDQCQNQTVLVATDNSTVVAYINKQEEPYWQRCVLLVPSLPDNTGCLLSRSNQVQSTEWSLHPQVFKPIRQKWFPPHVDLFATRLNHKLPLYVSPVPDQHVSDIDALNISGRVSLLMLTLSQLSFTGCNCLIIVIAPG